MTSEPAAAFCIWCGKHGEQCDGLCRRELDPPRYCSICGKSLIGQVTPTGYFARCKKHGPIPLAPIDQA